MSYIALMLYLAVAFILQFLTGDLPVSLMAFPLNVILFLIWLCGVYMIWKHSSRSLFARFMLSRQATISAIVLFLSFSLVIGLTGLRNLTSTWVFAAVMLYFQTVLLFVILRGWRTAASPGTGKGTIRWRFLLNHVGILLAVAAPFWGAPDSVTLRLQAFKDMPEREAYRMDGTSRWLSYEIEMKDFSVETYENGVPSMYEAELMIGGEPVTLKVNHPYSISFAEDLYLTGYDADLGIDPRYCIVQIVREPWKYGAVAGILMMLAGAFLLFAGGPKSLRSEEE